MKKVLVIGGNRYFGKRLVNLLLKNGNEVSVLNRGRGRDPFGLDITRLVADRSDEIALKLAVNTQKWDLIYDQCCQSSEEAKIACDVFQDKTNHYIFTSSQSVYRENGLEQKESVFDSLHTSYQMGSKNDFDYSFCKRYAESYFAKNAKFQVTSVRIPIILGEDDYTGRLEFHIDRIREGRPLVIENLDAKMCLMSSEDAANFLFGLRDQSLSGPINGASLGTLTIGEILGLISHDVGKNAVVNKTGEDGDRTPFVGPESKTMNIDLALSLGFHFSAVKDWLPKLIQHYN